MIFDKKHTKSFTVVYRRFAKVVILGLTFCVGCSTPNLLDEPAPTRPMFDASRFGANVEEVNLPINKEESLRGVFVSAGTNSPVVLHLLGGGDTLTAQKEIAGKIVWIGNAVADLLRLGFSSLVLDYRGVGRSSGKEDSQQLPLDAHVAWEEAVRRAGGNSGRVAIRAISLGTLAAVSLLEEGAKPGAIVLIAPLRAETVAVHWLYSHRSPLIAFLGRLFLFPALDVKMTSAILKKHNSLTIVFGTRDELLPKTEQEIMRVAARNSGAIIIDRDQDHLSLVRDAHNLLSNEYISYYPLRRG